MMMESVINSLGERVDIRRKDGNFVCPICGFAWRGTETFKTENILNGLEVCQCCSTQLGYHDVEQIPPDPTRPAEVRWKQLRTKWLDKSGWPESALEQLRTNLGIDTDALKLEAGRGG